MFISSCISSARQFIQDSANEALFCLSQIGYSENKKWTWLRYWPSLLAGAIAVAATIAAIANYVLANTPSLIFFTCIAVGAWLLAGTLHIFIPLKQLERQTEDLRKQTQTLQQQNTSLQNDVIKIQQTAQELKIQNQERERINKENEASLNAHLEKSQTAISSLEQKIQGLEKLLSLLQTTSTAFEKEVVTFQSIGQDISHTAPLFEQATLNLTKATDEMRQRVQDIQEQNSLLKTQCTTLDHFSKGWTGLLTSIRDVYRNINKAMTSLQKEVQELKAATTGAKEANSSFQEDIARLESLVHEAQKQDPFIFKK